MKIINLLNKIANGEEVPKRIRIDHWCYKFEWKDYARNYIDEREDVDLMSVLSCDREELNYEVRELKEDKKIEKLSILTFSDLLDMPKEELVDVIKEQRFKINEIIDYLNKEREQ